MPIDDFVFLRDYVSTHVDALADRIWNESESKLEFGEKEVHTLLPASEETAFDD